MQRYKVDYSPEEEGAQYAIVDMSWSEGGDNGLVLGDIYQKEHADKIVSLLNGEQAALQAKDARIAELELRINVQSDLGPLLLAKEQELERVKSTLTDVLREARAIASAYTKQRRDYYDHMADFADDPKMTDQEIGRYEPAYQRAQAFLTKWGEQHGN